MSAIVEVLRMERRRRPCFYPHWHLMHAPLHQDLEHLNHKLAPMHPCQIAPWTLQASALICTRNLFAVAREYLFTFLHIVQFTMHKSHLMCSVLRDHVAKGLGLMDLTQE